MQSCVQLPWRHTLSTLLSEWQTHCTLLSSLIPRGSVCFCSCRDDTRFLCCSGSDRHIAHSSHHLSHMFLFVLAAAVKTHAFYVAQGVTDTLSDRHIAHFSHHSSYMFLFVLAAAVTTHASYVARGVTDTLHTPLTTLPTCFCLFSQLPWQHTLSTLLREWQTHCTLLSSLVPHVPVCFAAAVTTHASYVAQGVTDLLSDRHIAHSSHHSSRLFLFVLTAAVTTHAFYVAQGVTDTLHTPLITCPTCFCLFSQLSWRHTLPTLLREWQAHRTLLSSLVPRVSVCSHSCRDNQRFLRCSGSDRHIEWQAHCTLLSSLVPRVSVCSHSCRDNPRFLRCSGSDRHIAHSSHSSHHSSHVFLLVLAAAVTTHAFYVAQAVTGTSHTPLITCPTCFCLFLQLPWQRVLRHQRIGAGADPAVYCQVSCLQYLVK